MHTATLTQRFGVPALVAATFHVVLLFGFRPPVATAFGAVVADPPLKLPPMPVELIAPPQAAPEFTNEPVKQLNSGPAQPPTPDRSTPNAKVDFGTVTTSNVAEVAVHLEKIPENWGPGGPGEVGGPSISTPRFFAEGELDATPRAKVQVSPEYPFALRQAGIEGNVKVEFDVDASGRVVSARAISSTQRDFEDAAVRAVLKWRFEPGRRHGKAVPFRMIVPIGFTMTDGK